MLLHRADLFYHLHLIGGYFVLLYSLSPVQAIGPTNKLVVQYSSYDKFDQYSAHRERVQRKGFAAVDSKLW